MKSEKDSLLRDLVDPVKSFVEEVHNDTVGDAKKFYSGQAKKVKRNVEEAQVRAQQKKIAQKRQQEEQKKQRKVIMKRAMVVFVVIIVAAVVILSLILNKGLI